MADSTPLTLIHGPTIRRGTENASHVRSQLMRQRYREKRLRILRNNNQIDTQHHQIENPSLPAGNNLRPIAPCRIDPFLPDDRRTSHFDFLLHTCLHVVLPTARPDGFAERSLRAFLHPDRDPMVIQSLFYSATLSMHALPIVRGAQNSAFASGPAPSAVIPPTYHLQLKGFVLNEIRRKLSTVDGSDLQNDKVDDIVLSILYLAANENLDQIRPPEKSPFSPPFRRLQSMELYGSCEFHNLHWQTVQHIILQRGGLPTVKLYGLPWLISMSGLIVAVNTDCKPVFPLIYPDGKPFVYRAPLQALTVPELPRHLTLRNRGFQQFALLHPPLKGTIIRVFLDLTEITQALQYLAGQPCGNRLLTLIGDTRSNMIHRLCNLPNQADRPNSILHKRKCTVEEQDRAITIFIISRKTALLYSAHVVLPLPQTSLIRSKMTLEIYEYMLLLKGQRADNELEILLWCSIVTGICATPMIQSWFVREARDLCNALNITTWDGLLEIMRSFAWLDCASDEAGKVMWSRIQRYDGNTV
ncbi:hypothetical protein ZTR_07284 [Talaromyces verruculosus]|nr:hypothetical protein ZTR_07284 [Talaromyces verruculosus]